jgi:hypothetical protein
VTNTANTVLMCLYDITGSREVTYPWKTTSAVNGLPTLLGNKDTETGARVLCSLFNDASFSN